MKARFAAAALIVLGCVQMAGDLSGQHAVKALGLLSHASPAPKVFTAQNGFETFSSRFFIDWTDTRGMSHSLELTPHTYRAIKGPYNRRNAYGAAISYGPVLNAHPRTRPLFESALRHSFCGDAPLLAELGIARATIVFPLHVRLEPREAKSHAPQWQTTFPVQCP